MGQCLERVEVNVAIQIRKINAISYNNRTFKSTKDHKRHFMWQQLGHQISKSFNSLLWLSEVIEEL